MIPTDEITERLPKYLTIWVWSILFGAMSSLSYMMTNIGNYIGDYGEYSLVFVGFGTYLALLIIYNWINLYKFLKDYIIPVVFLKEEISTDSEIKVFKYLSRSFYVFIGIIFAYMIITILSRYIGSL